MAKKDDLLIRVETLTLPGELKEKLNLLISRCPEKQINTVETMIERYEIEEKIALKSGIKDNPKRAKQTLHQFQLHSNELLASYVSEKENIEAEASLNQDLHEL